MGKWGTHSRFAALCALALMGGCAVHREVMPAPDTSAAARRADDFSCKRSEAKAVKYTILELHPERFADNCVRLALFTNGEDFAESASTLRAPLPKGAKRLIFHFDETIPGRQLPRAPSFISVVARVRVCPPADKTCLDGVYVSDIRVLPTAMD